MIQSCSKDLMLWMAWKEKKKNSRQLVYQLSVTLQGLLSFVLFNLGNDHLKPWQLLCQGGAIFNPTLNHSLPIDESYGTGKKFKQKKKDRSVECVFKKSNAIAHIMNLGERYLLGSLCKMYKLRLSTYHSFKLCS